MQISNVPADDGIAVVLKLFSGRMCKTSTKVDDYTTALAMLKCSLQTLLTRYLLCRLSTFSSSLPFRGQLIDISRLWWARKQLAVC